MIKKILNSIFLISMITALMLISYLIYLEVPREEQELTVQNQSFEEQQNEKIKSNQSFEEILVTPQFYENMRFNHNNLSYYIDLECSDEKNKRMKKGFNEISSRTKIISFYEIKNETQADISVFCSDEKIEKQENIFVLGEGGPSSVINSSLYPVIEKGNILLYKSSKCEEPLIEIHELLHVFGFDHVNDSKNILNPYLECDQELKKEHINKLIELYSIEPLSDIYIELVTASISGRYLDFEVLIKNQGLIDSENPILKIYNGEKLIKEFEIEEIKYGAGKRFYVKNLKLPALSINKIKLKIISESKDLNEANNLLILETDE